MNVRGWRIFYGDGAIVSSLSSSWEDAPAENIQMVTFYYDKGYPIYRDGKWEVEDYCLQLCGHDYYWFGGAGAALDVPVDSVVKLGKLLPDADWWPLYNSAKEVRTL